MPKKQQPSVQSLVIDWIRAKAEAEVAAQALKEAAESAMDAMQAAGVREVSVPDQYGGELRTVMVESSTVQTDYDALAKRLDPTTLQQVQTTVTYVDKDKVEAMVALGVIKAEDVADVSEIKPKRPYLKGTGTYDIETLGLKRP